MLNSPVIMYTIGFTTKFYTLWDVTVEHFTNEYGRKGERVTANYIKNISMDEQAARAKYPDAPVDLGLRGHSSFCRTNWEPLPSDVFPCGKYMGQPIADCTDFGYLYWAVDTNMLCGESRDIAVAVLLGSGQYGQYDDMILPMDRVNDLLAQDATRDEIAAAIDINGCVELLNVSNIKDWDENGFGSETGVDRVNLIWDRAAIERFEYNGWEYFLPVKGGKAKRIKGKKLRIIADHYTNDRRYLDVYVKDFEIVK